MANMRDHNRVKAEVAVEFEDGTSARTRDVSPVGVFIATDGPFQIGQTLRFSIDFDSHDRGADLVLHCVGVVTRVVSDDGTRLGIGVSIRESRLDRRAARRPSLEAAVRWRKNGK
jgi:hypothetical protein